MDMISANVLFSPANANEATTAVNQINTNVRRQLSTTTKVLVDRGYSIFSAITRTGMVPMGGKKSRQKYKRSKKSKKYRRV
jgi:hypothetical protein